MFILQSAMQQWPHATAPVNLVAPWGEKKKVSEGYIQDSILSREFKTNRTEQYHSDK